MNCNVGGGYACAWVWMHMWGVDCNHPLIFELRRLHHIMLTVQNAYTFNFSALKGLTDSHKSLTLQSDYPTEDSL